MFQATVFNVMIASPGDVPTERQIVRDVIFNWNVINAADRQIVLLPVGWETHSYPATGDHPQKILNDQILDPCDLLIGLFWTRIGTATNEFISGTVEEIERHLQSRKPAMLYFSSAPISPSKLDPDQYKELTKFRESCKGRCLYADFDGSEDLRKKFYDDLSKTMINDTYFSKDANPALVESRLQRPELSNEAKQLFKAASQDQNGAIWCYDLDQNEGAIQFQTNNTEFYSKDPRTQATWENGFAELEDQKLIKAQGDKRIHFKVTDKGYKVAETIVEPQPSQELSDEAKELLKAASQDPNGEIQRLYIKSDGKLIFATKERQFHWAAPRIEAQWNEGFEELKTKEYIRSVDERETHFKVTAQGFDFAATMD
jgi:hypothetical protein